MTTGMIRTATATTVAMTESVRVFLLQPYLLPRPFGERESIQKLSTSESPSREPDVSDAGSD